MHKQDYLTLKQICALLQVHPQTIYVWRKNGEFPPAIRIGRRKLLWRKEEVLNWLDWKNTDVMSMENNYG